MLYTGVKNEYEIADKLDINRSTLINQKHRNSVPLDKLEQYCRKENILLDGLLDESQDLLKEAREVMTQRLRGLAITKKGDQKTVITTKQCGGSCTLPPGDVLRLEYVSKKEDTKTVCMEVAERWAREAFPGPSKEDIAVYCVQSDNMNGTIRVNDMLLIDRSVNKILADGIYVFETHAGSVNLRRVHLRLDGRIDVVNDNRMYASNNTTIEELLKTAKVIGRVLGRYHRL
jgi:hypothetical protein